MSKELLVAEVHELYNRGYSIREIATETGVSKSSIGRIIKVMNEKMPGTAAGTCPNLPSRTVGTGSGTAQNPVPNIECNVVGTQVYSIDSENNVVSPENEAIEEANDRFNAHVRFFNGEIDAFIGDLLLLTGRRYMLPFALLERYQQKALRLLTQGAQICWEMGFDCNEYKQWDTLSIVLYYLNDYINKGYSVFKPGDLVDFQLESLYVNDIKEIKSAEFFPSNLKS